MAIFDRSQFKKKNDAFDDSAVAAYTNKGQRIGYHTIDTGNNWHRFYPDPKGGKFLTPKVVSWLPVEVEETDSKSNKKKTTIKRMPILNSKVHFNTPKDLVEEYIDLLRVIMKEEIQDEDELKKRLFPLEGDAKSYLTTCKPNASWIAYTDKYTKDKVEFGRLEMGAAIKGKMKVLQEGQEDPEDVANGVDIFCDPDLGRKVNIISKPDEKNPQDKYGLAIDLNKVTPLDDETLEEHSKRESLADTLKFKPEDFQKQLKGLKLFDDEHSYGVFADDRWLTICEEIAAYYPDEETDKKDDEPKKKSETIKRSPAKTTPAAKKIDSGDEEPEESIDNEESIENGDTDDEFTDMDRTALKIYNRDHKLGIFVTGKLSDDDIRTEIRKAVAATAEAIEEEPVEEEPEETAPLKKAAAPKKVDAKGSAKDRINQIKEKAKKK